MSDWETFKHELLQNPEFKQAYDELEPAYNLAHSIIKARLEMQLTQAELAEKAGISQVMVSRLESMDGNPTVKTINKVAKVLGKKLDLVTAK